MAILDVPFFSLFSCLWCCNMHYFISKKHFFYCVCVKRFAIACVLLLLLLVFLPGLSGISGNLEQKTISRTIEQLIQCTVLESQFQSLKCMVFIRMRKSLSNFPSLSKCQAIQGDLQYVDINNPHQMFSNVLIAFAQKAKRFVIVFLLLLFFTTFPEERGIRSKEIFYGPLDS